MGGIPLLGSSLQSWGKGNLDLCKPQALHSVPLPVPEAFDWKRGVVTPASSVSASLRRGCRSPQIRSMCPVRCQEGGTSFELQRERLPHARELDLLSCVWHI